MNLPDHIRITHDLKSAVAEACSRKQYSQVAVLADENTKRHCAPLLHPHLPPHRLIQVPAGEAHKTLDTCTHVWQGLTDLAFDRHGLLVVLGGGVLGDLGGFCAATYKRGIDFLLVPTTLLSQVDASVGGKLAIDFQGYKNHIGVFQEPTATLIDTTFLKTLPERELRSGFAEIIKHCLIADRAMFDKIRKQPWQTLSWDALVEHSVAIKYSVTSQDPKESGLRKILNAGHTVGHAIETWFLNTADRLYHGEAIAIGMVAEAWIAKAHQLITDEELRALSSYIISVYGKVTLPADKSGILEHMRQDKKNRGNTVLMALPKGIGQAVWDVAVSPEEIGQSLQYYESL